MKQQSVKYILIILLIAVLVILSIVLIVWWNYSSQKFSYKSTPTICTKEAKICPDGSTVGREGPKCEFTECPK